jgi:hypothetical protein
MANKTKKTVPNTHYIVTYKVGLGDPVQVFTTLETCKKFVTALITKDQSAADQASKSFKDSSESVDDVENSSIKVYKGTLIGKPKVEVIFTE